MSTSRARRRRGSWALGLLAASTAAAAGAVLLVAGAGAKDTPGPSEFGRMSRAKIAMVDRDLVLAERLLREALEADPSRRDARLLLGRVLLERGRPSAAQECFSAALREEPRDAEALRGMARALQAQGRFEQAVVAWHQAAEARRDDPQIWRELGLAQKERGDLLGALSSIQQSLSLDPSQSDLSGLLAELAGANLHAPLEPGLPQAKGGLDAFDPRPLDPERLVPRPKGIDPNQFLPRPANGRLR